jgi:hypothetical protein
VHRHGLLGQAGEIDLSCDRLSDEVGEVRGVLVLGVAVVDHHEQPFVAHRSREVPQQQDRGTIEPVRVVENQDEWAVGSDLAEQPRDSFELAKAVFSRREGVRSRVRPAEHLGRQPCEVPVGFRDTDELNRAAEELTPRPVRRSPLGLDSDPPQGGHTADAGQTCQLFGKPRLAYTRLPATQHDARTPLLRVIQIAGERS